MDKSKKVSIIIPVFNEEKAVGGVIDDIKSNMSKTPYNYEIIVVDDASEDRTAEVVRSRQVKLLCNMTNEGGGAARTRGILASEGEVMVVIDGDATYAASDIPLLLDYIGDYDMAVGARTSEKGTVRFLRSIAKNFIRGLASYLTGTHIPDLNSGLRAIKKDVFLKYMYILPQGHSWVSTITLALLSNYYQVKYVPIAYHKRIGKSTFHPLHDTYAYLTLVVRTIVYFNPLKVFLPISIALFLIGLISSSINLCRSAGLQQIDIIIVLCSIIIAMMGLLADLIVVTSKRAR
jgi:polyisoprenyl-phosphate glycosyltransferase